MSKTRLKIVEKVGSIHDGMSGLELLELVGSATQAPYFNSYISITRGWDEDFDQIEMFGIRAETNEEYEKRLEKEAKREAKMKATKKTLAEKKREKDWALYKELKKQFEP